MIKVNVHEETKGRWKNDQTLHQLITQSRQRGAQTTSAHLHWCGPDPSSSWPAQVASHKGHAPKRGYILAIFEGVFLNVWVQIISTTDQRQINDVLLTPSCFSSLSRSDSSFRTVVVGPCYSIFDFFFGKLKSFVTIDQQSDLMWTLNISFWSNSACIKDPQNTRKCIFRRATKVMFARICCWRRKKKTAFENRFWYLVESRIKHGAKYFQGMIPNCSIA